VSAYADAFVAPGLPPNLLQDFEESIAGFAAARDEQAASRQRFTAAFESIGETLGEADRAVDVLEAIVLNTPGAPSELLTKLRLARRVGPRALLREVDRQRPPGLRIADQPAGLADDLQA
jgi:hypothetical protein